MINRRRLAQLLASVALLPSFANARLFGGGAATATNTSFSATLQLVNAGGSTTTAGTPTQSFVWIFRQGDIPSGQAPIFTVSGVTQPFSASPANMRRYWPDGSLQSCAFALRPTFTATAGATTNVTIFGGGSWPLASNRTTTEVYNQGLNIQLPSAPISGNGFSGASQTWGAWLTSANSTNIISTGAMAPMVDLDGDAGKRWRFTAHMSQTEGGAQHGQLVTTFHVWALSNSSGTLGGFRWSGYVRQPFYDVNSPSKAIRVFKAPDTSTPTNGPYWSASGVSPTAYSMLGFDSSPVTSRGLTITGGNATTTTAHNWSLNNNNVYPCYLTGSNLPTSSPQVDGNTVYFVLTGATAGATTTAIELYYNAGGFAGGSSSLISFSNNGTGVHTIVPCVASVPFNKNIQWRGADGKYLFFQGTGSITTETTLRSTIDKTYWQSTKVIPPFDLSVDSSGFTSTGYTSPWSPVSTSTIHWDQSDVGDHPDIGVLGNEASLDFFKQSAATELSIRCFGTAAANTQFDFYYSGTGTIVNLSDISPTGFQAADQATLWNSIQWGEAGTQGFTAPPSNCYSAVFKVDNREHRPQYSLWAWLRTGEWDFMDLLIEEANSGILCNQTRYRNLSSPSTANSPYVGCGFGFDVEYRSLAWAQRDIAWAALFAPNPAGTMGDGTATATYFARLDAVQNLHVQDAMNPANGYYDNVTISGSTSYMTGRKLFAPRDDGQAYIWLTNSPEWEFAFNVFGFCISKGGGDANAALNITDSAARWEYVRTNFGLWNLTGYYTYWGAADGGDTQHHTGSFCIAADYISGTSANYGWGTYNAWDTLAWGVNLSPSPANRGFQFQNLRSGYTPGNNDFFYAGSLGITGMPDTWAFIKDWDSGTNTFNLTLTRGGTDRVAVSNSGTYSGVTPLQAVNASLTDWDSRQNPGSLGLAPLHQIRAAACWGNALGETGFAAQIADWDNRLANTTGGPYHTYQDQLNPDLTTVTDVRYVYQSTYHA